MTSSEEDREVETVEGSFGTLAPRRVLVDPQSPHGPFARHAGTDWPAPYSSA